MRYLYVLIFLGFSIAGCLPVDEELLAVRNYQSIDVPTIYKDAEGNLYFGHVKGQESSSFEDGKERALYLLDQNHTWIKIADDDEGNITIGTDEYDLQKIKDIFAHIEAMDAYEENGTIITPSEYVTYTEGVVTVRERGTGEELRSTAVPSAMEIANATGENIYDYQIGYIPYFSDQFQWDETQHLASICIDKHEYDCADILYFRLQKENETWDVEKIISLKEYEGINRPYLADLFEGSEVTHWSTNGKYDYCLVLSTSEEDGLLDALHCFVPENDIVAIKPLFGEIFPNSFRDMYEQIYDNSPNRAYSLTLDDQGNIHLFYNKREDIENSNYDYFWYGYFTKENPTEPLYEQKIPWN